MSSFAGFIQIKFNRIISEQPQIRISWPNTGLHAGGITTVYLDHETNPHYSSS